MSVVPRRHRIAALALAVALAVVVLTVSLELGTPTSSFSASGLGAFVATGTCPGSALPHNYSGTVAFVDAPSPPTVSLNYSYDAVVTTNLTNGVVLSTVCSTENGTTVGKGAGGFDLSIDPTPAVNCTIPLGGQVGTCVSVSGPYEQVNVTPTAPLPPGDFSAVTRSGTAFQVRIYPYLATVRLHPGPPSATYSPGGIEEFRATPFTGEGTPTPMVPEFTWTIAGTGWTFVAPSRGANVSLTAAPAAGVGNLTAFATLNVTGGTLVTPRVSVELLAVATTISVASLNRTMLDVGQSVTAHANGSGAAGYRYAATVDPGLGEPEEPATCTTVPATPGTVTVSCTTTWNYTGPGVAQPAVTVSNGVSAAVWEFPEVTVDPSPSLAFLPGLPVGYANETVPIEVQAGPGTGTPPYAEACLSSGVGAPQCLRSSGPTWTFAPVYSAPGSYSASAWAIDATGLNRSATTVVRIVGPLEVNLSTNATTGAAGTPLPLTAVLSGGDLPARVWWNVTGLSNPVASGWIATDGPVRASFVPPTAGYVSVSVVVVDSLGTSTTAVETLTIGVGAGAAAVPVVLPPAVPVPAGTPFGVAWQALDSGGDVDHDFAATGEIELMVVGARQPAPGWVNASGVGPLASRLPGWFEVPAAAWIGGDLNVSITSRTSGSIRVDLVVGAGLPSGAGSVGVVVLPDVDHLRLFDPRTLVSGDRTNDTLWQVADRFGNPATGASLVVTASFGGTTVRTVSPVVREPNGATEAWVNVTAPDALAGSVSVTDLAGDALLPLITVPGLSGAWSVLATLPLALGGGAGAGAGVVVLVRGRSRRTVAPEAPLDEEAALQRLAEGRATVVEIVRRGGPVDLAGVARAWDPPPAPPDLADWVASLLTDGTLDATLGADGVARFGLARSDGARPQVTLDLEAYDRAQLRKDAATGEWERGDP